MNFNSDAKPQQSPKLPDQVRDAIRVKHLSYSAEKTYIHWIKTYIYLHDKRHPKEMGEKEISQFLSHLATKRKVSASTQNQALCGIVFLYKEVLKRDIGDLNLVWAKEHFGNVRNLHQKDLQEGYGMVYLPDALERKYPSVAKEWIWQFTP